MKAKIKGMKIFLLLNLFFLSNLVAQEYSYKQYTIFDGLPQNQIITCYQDSYGFLWVGTKLGHARFDGRKFKIFQNNKNAYGNNFKIREYNGALIHYGEGGLFVLKDNQFCQIYGKCIYSLIFQAEKNRLFLSNPSSFRVYNWKNNTFSNFNTGVPDCVTSSCAIGDEVLFSTNYGIYYKKDSVRKLLSNRGGTIVRGKSSFYILSHLYEDNHHKGSEIYRLSNGKMEKIYEVMQGLISSELSFSSNSSSIYFAQNNSKWVNIDTNGLVLDSDSLSDVYINYVYQGSDGCVWLASETGLYRLLSNAFINYTEKSGMPKYVWSILGDSDSTLVFATFLGKLYEMNKNVLSEVDGYKRHLKIAEQFYFNGFINSREEWVLPTSHRLIVKNKNQIRFVDFNSNGKYVYILSCYEDTTNNYVYFGTTDGVFVCDSNWNIIKNIHTNNKNVLSIEKDKYNRIWFCTNGGVVLYDADKLLSFKRKEVPVEQSIISCKRDVRANMWMAKRDSLVLHKYDTIINIYKGFFVFINQVSDKYIVAGSVLGILVVDLEKFYEGNVHCMKFFDRYNGFIGIECGQNGTYVDNQASIWINTSESVIRFFPEKVLIDYKPPKPIIYSLNVADSDLKWNEIVAFPISDNRISEIDWRQNNIKIDFVGIDFFCPERVSYRYRLVGQSDTWIYDSTGVVVYTNLSPGKYQFELSSRNENGVWNEKPVKMLILVKAAFWQTLWFKIMVYLLVILFFISIFLSVKRYRSRKKKREMLVKSELASHQLEMLNSQLDPHFIFNVLSAIGTEVKSGNNDRAYEYYVRISRILRESLSFKSQMFRSLNEELRFVDDYLELQKFRFGSKIEYAINVDPEVDKNVLVPKMCLQIFVENSIKHGLGNKIGNGKVEINIKYTNHAIEIEVIDDGVGRKNARAKENNGIGIEVMQNFFELMNKYNSAVATIEIIDLQDENNLATGTKVLVVLPTGYRFYFKKEVIKK